MKKRIVCWGKDAEGKRHFFTLALQVTENQVEGHAIPGDVLTQEFENILSNQWREGGDVQFPEGTKAFTTALTVTESLIPEGFELDNHALIKRSQSEWNFLVMSQKLADLYQQEVDDFKDKIDSMTSFDGNVWDGLKNFWGKVNDQIKEKNLLRGHGNDLRDKTNKLFDQMKELRKRMDNEFREMSERNREKITKSLEEIEEKIEGGLSLQPLFNQLKKVQQELKGMDLTKGHRRKLWDRIDKNFKTIKTKRYGDEAKTDGNGKSRLQHRYDGLLEVIDRMERSIKRDRNDLDFQNKRINTTAGQLEAQLRQAKLQMIEERIASKDTKLQDMLKTKAELETRLEKEKERERKRAEKAAHDAKVAEAKAEIKDKIADNIASAQSDRTGELDKLLKAADSINTSRAKKQKSAKTAEPKSESAKADEELTVTEFFADKLEDAIDTAKAVALIVGNKIEEVVDELRGESQEE